MNNWKRLYFSTIFIVITIIFFAGCSGGGGDSLGGTTSDTTAPTAPMNFNATATSSSQINLSWNASTDNVGVAGYKIYRGGVYLKSVTGLTASDSGLSSSTSYCYTVSAYDAANNESSQSTQACATTPPTTPTNLNATAASISQINLSWDLSTGVAGYKIYRGGVYLKSVTGNTVSDTGLSSNTSYCYTVSAYDAENNESSQSIQACATTHYTKQLGTGAEDDGHGVAIDTNGNVYVTGYTLGGLDGNISAGSADIFLVKYNAAGVKQWTKQMGTESNDFAYGVAVDTSGNIYITGETDGGLDGNTNAGSSDIFLIKYDATGTKQWTRQLGTATIDTGKRVAVDTSGNVYVTGYTLAGLDGNTYAGGADIFLVKYNASGTKQWTRQLGTTGFDEGIDIAVDISGNVYVTGWTEGDLDGNTNAGGWDMFLVKYNAAGTKQWTRQLGTSLDDVGSGIVLDTSGNIYITGSTKGGFDGNTNAGGWDMFLVKYDATGTKQWTQQLGTASKYYFFNTRVALDTSGNIYVTGSSGLAGGQIFLVKYSAAVTKQWTQLLSPSANIYSDGIALDISGNIYVSGSTNGALDGNTNVGSYDMFLMKFNANGVIQ